MKDQEFPNCCGIMTLSDFGWTNVTGGDYGAGGNGSIRQAPPTKEVIKNYISSSLDDYRDYAIITVALNETQNKELGELFTNSGFKLVSQGLNSHHKSQIFLYTFCNTEYFSHEEDDFYDEEYYDYEEEV